MQINDCEGKEASEERFLSHSRTRSRAPHARPLAFETMYWEDDDVEALQRAVAQEEAKAAASAKRAASKAPPPAAAAPAPSETHPPVSDRVAALESRAAALVAERDAMEESLLAARAEMRALSDARSSELADARAEADEMVARVKRAEADAAESAAAASRLRREADRAEFEAREKVERMEKEAKELMARLARVTEQRDESERRVCVANAATNAANSRAARWKRGSDEGEARRRRDAATLERLSKETEALTERLAFAEAKSASLLGAVAARDAKLAARDAEAEAAASRLAAASRARAASDAERERLRTALAAVRAEANANASREKRVSRDADAPRGHRASTPPRLEARLSAPESASETDAGKKRADTDARASTRRVLRARDANAPRASSPSASPGKAKARRFAVAAKRASVTAAVGAGAWRAVRDRGGPPPAVPLFVV